jgi:hypothetical protein
MFHGLATVVGHREIAGQPVMVDPDLLKLRQLLFKQHLRSRER